MCHGTLFFFMNFNKGAADIVLEHLEDQKCAYAQRKYFLICIIKDDEKFSYNYY